MHKIGQSGEFLDKLLGALIKTGLPLMGNVLEPLAKSILVPLGLTAQHGGIIQKKNVWIWHYNIHNF